MDVTEEDVVLREKTERFISLFDLNGDQDLQDLISKLTEITDRVEEVHRKATIGSLSGKTIRAAGGITTALGLALAPVTMGTSLIAARVGVGVATAGGVTGAASNITDKIKQKTSRKEIEATLDAVQNQLNPLIESLVQIEAQIKNLESKPGYAGTGRAGLSVLDITQGIQRASAANIRPVTEQVSRTVRKGAMIKQVLAGLFGVANVFFIVQDAKELRQIKKRRREKEVNSATLKFIVEMKRTISALEEALEELREVKAGLDQWLQR